MLLSMLFVGVVACQSLHASTQDYESSSDAEEVAIEALAPADENESFNNALSELATASFSKKQTITSELVAKRYPGSRSVLVALLENQLYADKLSGKVLILAEKDGEKVYYDAISGELISDSVLDTKRITTNNSLRKKLRGDIAIFDLNSDDRNVRLAAVQQLREVVDQNVAVMLREQRSIEQDDDVAEEIRVTLAIFDLGSEDPAVRLAAVDELDGELGNDVFNQISALLQSEENREVIKAAEAAIKRIEGKRDFYSLLETAFFGLSFGSVLVLAAIGLAITFGVMGVINMAHGELIMLGAYTTFVMQQLLPNHIGLSIVLSIPAAFLVSGLVGIAIERGIVRFLYGRPLETLLATFGVSLILQQLVRTIFSPLNRSVQTPEMMSGLLRFNEVFAVTYNRLYILIFTFIVFAGLWLILNKTSLGLKVRAVSQNRQMARAMGVRTARVDALTFGLGSGVAGIAGVALSQLTNVGPNLGQAYIIDSFMVVVFGGVGNLWGTLVGGMTLGVATKFLEPHVGAVVAKIIMLVFIILFIQRRKQGLFPQKGRAASGA
ncbi:urea ABC transporter permease subunit UrtB [Alcanivorax sp. 1008]|nr:urea ABC transporter permease subunit UrtB [Alcanivorax sp. 1008]MCC1496524.1 urea ABC transporter permease subunit UrtB [Alcanivorax sp. 1008]